MLPALVRKWLNKPKRSDTRLLAQFFFADEEVGRLLSELNCLDMHRDPQHYLSLLNQLHTAQERMLALIAQISEQCIPQQLHRREYQMKFPDELLNDNISAHMLFAAELLVSGTYIELDEADGVMLSPLATEVLYSLEELRILLREQSLTDPSTYTDLIQKALIQFDSLSAEFELRYVSLVVSVKTPEEIFKQQEIVVLFCETIARALKLGYLTQDMIDVCEPQLMFTIPRLSIISGLLIYPDGPLNLQRRPEDMSKLFSPFFGLLRKIRDLLFVLSEEELMALEKSLCSVDSDDRQPDLSCFDEPQPSVTSVMDTPSELTAVEESQSNLINSHQTHPDLTGFAVSPESCGFPDQPMVTNPDLQELGTLDSSAQQVGTGTLGTETCQYADAVESRYPLASSTVHAQLHNKAVAPNSLMPASNTGELQVNEGAVLDHREWESTRPTRPHETMQRVLSFQEQLHREWIPQTATPPLHPGHPSKAADPVYQKDSQQVVFPVYHSPRIESVSIFHKDISLENLSSVQDGSSLTTANANPNAISQACTSQGHHKAPFIQSTLDRATLSAYSIPSQSPYSAEHYRISGDPCSQSPYSAEHYRVSGDSCSQSLHSSQSLASVVYSKPKQCTQPHVVPHKAGHRSHPVVPQNSISPLQHGLSFVSTSQSLPDSSAPVMHYGESRVSVSPVHPGIPQISTSSVHPAFSHASASPMHLGGLLVSTSSVHTSECQVYTSSVSSSLSCVFGSSRNNSMVTPDFGSSRNNSMVTPDFGSTMNNSMVTPDFTSSMPQDGPPHLPPHAHREEPKESASFGRSVVSPISTSQELPKEHASSVCNRVTWVSPSKVHMKVSPDSASPKPHQSGSQDLSSATYYAVSQNSAFTMCPGVSLDSESVHPGLSLDSLSMHDSPSKDSVPTMHPGVSQNSTSTMQTGLSPDSMSTINKRMFRHCECPIHSQGVSLNLVSSMHPEVTRDYLSTKHQAVSHDSICTIPSELSQDSVSTTHQGVSLDSAPHALQMQSQNSVIHQGLPSICASLTNPDVTLISVSAMHSEVPKVTPCSAYHAVPQGVDFKILQRVHQDSASTMHQRVPDESAGPLPLGMPAVLTFPVPHHDSDSPIESVSRQDSAPTLYHPLFASPVHRGFPQGSASPLRYRDLEAYPLSLTLCCGPSVESASAHSAGSLLEAGAPGHSQTPPWIQDSCTPAKSVLGVGSAVPAPKHTASANSGRPRRVFLHAQDIVGSRVHNDAASEHCRRRVPQPPITSHLSRHHGQNGRHLEELRRRRMQDMRELMRVEIRSRYRSTSDMLHRLFVCIAGVADQLQTNFASDLRPILKTVFEITASKSEAAEAPNTDQEEEALTHRPEGSPQKHLEDCPLCLDVTLHNTGDAESDPSLNEPPDWVPDRASSSCMECSAPFTLVRRRHHCRSCGKIFCSRCSPHMVPLPHFGLFKAVRVCNHCLTTHLSTRQSQLL